MKPSSLSPRLRSRSLLLISIPVCAYGTAAAYGCGRIVEREPRDSELQATLAGGVGQGLDAAVVAVTRTIERDLVDARGERLLGDRAADLGGGLDVLAALQAFLDVGLDGGGRSQHLRAVGGEQLGVDVLARAQHRQAGDTELADVRARALGAAQAGDVLVHGIYLEEAEVPDQAFLASFMMIFSPEYRMPLP